MTLIKSLLLGSAAGIVAVASAQAADLPTKKGAPAAQYVKICTITAGGKPITGFILPGSDTCLKISGYVTAQMEAGNLKTGYALSQATGLQAINAYTAARSSLGYTTRENVAFDAVSNTSMGPLLAHMDIQNENGNGFDNTGVGTYVNEAYIQWAGITAGKAESFYSFVGGGPAWANFFSPDQKGFNQPDLFAYTAAFGGGFSATLALQSAGTNSPSFPAGYGSTGSGGGTNMVIGGNAVTNGMRAPDVVAALRVDQAWGSAQLSGVAHDVRAQSLLDGSTESKWGFGIDGGVKFNVPAMGAGSNFVLTGSWTRNATWYSGLPDAMWGEAGAVNGNGQAEFLADTYSNGNGTWATPTAWSISATTDFHISPQFSLSPEASYGQISWSGTDANSLVSNSKTWLVGAVTHYDPVPGLDFELELLYQNSTTSQPNGYVAGNGIANTASWRSNGSGFAGRFEITRAF